MTIALVRPLLTRREVEERLHVSESTVRRLVRGGQIAAHKVGKQLRFSASDVDAYLESGRVGSISPDNVPVAGDSQPRPTRNAA